MVEKSKLSLDFEAIDQPSQQDLLQMIDDLSSYYIDNDQLTAADKSSISQPHFEQIMQSLRHAMISNGTAAQSKLLFDSCNSLCCPAGVSAELCLSRQCSSLCSPTDADSARPTDIDHSVTGGNQLEEVKVDIVDAIRAAQQAQTHETMLPGSEHTQSTVGDASYILGIESHIFPIIVALGFMLSALVFLLVLLINLPSYSEQVKYSKMLKREKAAANRRAAHRIWTVPVALRHNVAKGKNAKRNLNNVYMPLQDDAQDNECQPMMVFDEEDSPSHRYYISIDDKNPNSLSSIKNYQANGPSGSTPSTKSSSSSSQRVGYHSLRNLNPELASGTEIEMKSIYNKGQH